VQGRDARPQEGPEGRGGAGEGERHAPARKDQPRARAQHALTQAAQAPAGPGGMRHGAPGDVHHLIGQKRDEQANLVAREGVDGGCGRPRLAAAPVRLRPVGRRQRRRKDVFEFAHVALGRAPFTVMLEHLPPAHLFGLQ